MGCRSELAGEVAEFMHEEQETPVIVSQSIWDDWRSGGEQDRHIRVERSQAGIEGCQPALASTRDFRQPGVGYLSAALQVAVWDIQEVQTIAPPFVFRVRGDVLQGLPRRGGTGIDGCSHM